MPDTTPRLALTKPTPLDTVSTLRTAIAGNADKLDKAAEIATGTAASRPAPSSHKGFYRATDTGDLSFSDGSTWTDISSRSLMSRAGSTPGVSGPLEMAGTLKHLGPAGAFSAGATSITVNFAGWYRISLRIARENAAGVTGAIIRAGATSLATVRTTAQAETEVEGVVHTDLLAGTVLTAIADSPSGKTVTVKQFTVERLAP